MFCKCCITATMCAHVRLFCYMSLHMPCEVSRYVKRERTPRIRAMIRSLSCMGENMALEVVGACKALSTTRVYARIRSLPGVCAKVIPQFGAFFKNLPTLFVWTHAVSAVGLCGALFAHISARLHAFSVNPARSATSTRDGGSEEGEPPLVETIYIGRDIRDDSHLCCATC